MAIQIKRVYDAPAPGDGRRILVDRLWPRGMSRQRAALDGWLKDAAPSTSLRRWYGHDPERFDAFRQRYQAELSTLPAACAAVKALRGMAREGTLTLLYAAKDAHINHAAVLRDYLARPA